MNLKLVGILVAIVIGFVGIGILTSGDEDSTSSGNATITNHVQGDDELGLVLTEAGDFECPACAQFYPLVDQIKEEYKDRVQFQFAHYPLTSIHRNALAAHRAAEAAGKQDKFFEMHDILYENIEEWNGPSSVDPVGTEVDQAIEIFNRYAEELELDVEKFKTDFADPTTNSTINADISYYREKGVSSTPTFLFNGEIVSNRELDSLDKMRAFLDEKIKAAGGAVDEGTQTDQSDTTESSANDLSDPEETAEPSE